MKYFNRTLVRLAFLFCPFLTILSCGNNPSEATNQPPIITSVTATPDSLNWGLSSQLVVIAVDPEEQSLSYLWEATGGNFMTSTSNDTVLWLAPDSSGKFDVMVTVSDGENAVSKSDTITVRPSVTGRWRQRFTLSGTLFIGYYNLVQNGTTLTGDFVFSDGSGFTSLSSSSYIRDTSINMAWWLQTILLESRGTVSSSWNSMSGTMYARGSSITTWTATKMSSSAMVVAAPTTPSGKSMAEQFNQTMQKGVGF